MVLCLIENHREGGITSYNVYDGGVGQFLGEHPEFREFVLDGTSAYVSKGSVAFTTRSANIEYTTMNREALLSLLDYMNERTQDLSQAGFQSYRKLNFGYFSFRPEKDYPHQERMIYSGIRSVIDLTTDNRISIKWLYPDFYLLLEIPKDTLEGLLNELRE